jgi:hypothetical protein
MIVRLGGQVSVHRGVVLMNVSQIRVSAALLAGMLLPPSTPVEGASSCLAGYSERLCELLPQDAVRGQVPEMAESPEVNTGTKSFKLCGYSWTGPRQGKRKIRQMEFEYSIDDQVAIQWLRVLGAKDSPAYFRNAYRTMTPEEKERAAQALREAMDKKVEAGELSKDGAKIGKGLTGGMLSSLKSEEVPGLGTAAAWGG